MTQPAFTSRVTTRAKQPLTAAEARDTLRLTQTDLDGEIAQVLEQATSFVESRLNRTLTEATRETVFQGTPDGRQLAIPYGPISTLTSIEEYDASDDAYEQLTEGAAEDYVVVQKDPYGIVDFETSIAGAHRLRVTYDAGNTQANVPPALKNAVRDALSWLWEHGDQPGPEDLNLAQKYARWRVAYMPVGGP